MFDALLARVKEMLPMSFERGVIASGDDVFEAIGTAIMEAKEQGAVFTLTESEGLWTALTNAVRDAENNPPKMPENTFFSAMTLDAVALVDLNGNPVLPKAYLYVPDDFFGVLRLTIKKEAAWFYWDTIPGWYIEGISKAGLLYKVPFDRYTGLVQGICKPKGRV